MKEEHIWTKKPETMLDWFCVVGACIALYLTLNNLGYFLGKIGVFIGIVSPFAGGIVIAYVLDPMVKFFYTKLFKEKKRRADSRFFWRIWWQFCCLCCWHGWSSRRSWTASPCCLRTSQATYTAYRICWA